MSEKYKLLGAPEDLGAGGDCCDICLTSCDLTDLKVIHELGNPQGLLVCPECLEWQDWASSTQDKL